MVILHVCVLKHIFTYWLSVHRSNARRNLNHNFHYQSLTIAIDSIDSTNRTDLLPSSSLGHYNIITTISIVIV